MFSVTLLVVALTRSCEVINYLDLFYRHVRPGPWKEKIQLVTPGESEQIRQANVEGGALLIAKTDVDRWRDVEGELGTNRR